MGRSRQPPARPAACWGRERQCAERVGRRRLGTPVGVRVVEASGGRTAGGANACVAVGAVPEGVDVLVSRMPVVGAHLTVGAAGCGRTRIAAAFPRSWRLSLDDCREMVCGDFSATFTL